jgi:voltage-gated potassium channel
MKIVNFDTQRTGEKPAGFSERRERIHQIVFESDTREGRLFDLVLLWMILFSIVLLMLESVPSIQAKWGRAFYLLEWVVTVFFAIEYLLRLYCVFKPMKYATSFFGLVDIASILPMFLDLFIPGAHSLMIVRSLRLLRLFRIFKMNIFVNQGNQIVQAIRMSREKILVFTFFVVLMVFVFGSVMYVVEGPTNPKFDSIPTSIYWAVVTITTVGYGDISPITPLGKFFSSLVMLLGYAVIAVPTGIVTSSLVNLGKKQSAQHCFGCSKEGHDEDARYCKYCGTGLDR